MAELLGLALGIVISIVDFFFTDTEDKTSDDGVHTGPDDLVGNDPTFIPTRVQMLDMSANRHIYQPAQRDLLALRAYAGKWGGHNGIFNISPPFAPKTGRTSDVC